jgi:signal transduction histidine kinase
MIQALRARWSQLSLRQQLTFALFGTACAWLAVALVLRRPEVAWGAAGAATLALIVPAMASERLQRTLRGSSARIALLAEGTYEAIHTVPENADEGAPLDDALSQLSDAIRDRETALQSSLLQMRELERLKTDFVSTVSHELRTPLTSMRGALGLVLSGTTGELPLRARDLLKIAQSNTDRLIRLINEMLDIEKIEAGHVSLKREWCELTALAQQTQRGLETLAMEAGVRLAVDAARDVFVSGDADRLVQVMTNLVSNAIKFSPRGGTVTIRIEAEGQAARIHVVDQGPGIPSEFRSRIFGRFQQADSGDARRASGTGLGLAIARAIVEMHDGSIGFDTNVGRGTTFTVELPWSPPTAAPATADGYRILLVDADLGMLSVLGTLCAGLGETYGVRSTLEAWEAARSVRVDALIIDLALDGAGDFVRRVRRQPGYQDLPVLVFSSREFAGPQLEGITLSNHHVFVKSRDPETDVVMRLRAMLAVRRPRVAAA